MCRLSAGKNGTLRARVIIRLFALLTRFRSFRSLTMFIITYVCTFPGLLVVRMFCGFLLLLFFLLLFVPVLFLHGDEFISVGNCVRRTVYGVINLSTPAMCNHVNWTATTICTHTTYTFSHPDAFP